MNEVIKMAEFAVGALTIAASRDAAIRAEVLKIGDPVRVLHKGSFGSGHDVDTGVIVAFEPFKELPTVVVAYVESKYGSAEMKMLAFNDKTENVEIIAAPPSALLSVERKRVLDTFDNEERKELAELDEIRAKRAYFDQHFGCLFADVAQVPGPDVAEVEEAPLS